MVTGEMYTVMKQTKEIWFDQNQNSFGLKILKGMAQFDLHRD